MDYAFDVMFKKYSNVVSLMAAKMFSISSIGFKEAMESKKVKNTTLRYKGMTGSIILNLEVLIEI